MRRVFKKFVSSSYSDYEGYHFEIICLFTLTRFIEIISLLVENNFTFQICEKNLVITIENSSVFFRLTKWKILFHDDK